MGDIRTGFPRSDEEAAKRLKFNKIPRPPTTPTFLSLRRARPTGARQPQQTRPGYNQATLKRGGKKTRPTPIGGRVPWWNLPHPPETNFAPMGPIEPGLVAMGRYGDGDFFPPPTPNHAQKTESSIPGDLWEEGLRTVGVRLGDRTTSQAAAADLSYPENGVFCTRPLERYEGKRAAAPVERRAVPAHG
jgi:hypothetical protein